MTVDTKYVFQTVTADSSDKSLPSCMISTINADRVGDRVIPEGCDFTNFMKSPVLMWAHGGREGYAAVPIGTVTGLEVMPGKGIRASWRWLDKDPFADRIKNAWDQGVVRASSIGFKPLQATPNGHGMDIERFELYELSLCAVPMNPEATRALKSLLDLEPPAVTAEPEPEHKADPEHVEKRGRVLSAVNESKLRAAVISLSDATRVLAEVLAQLEAAKPADDDMPMEEPAHPREPMMDPEEYALVLADEPVLRLLLAEEPDDDVIVCALVDDPQQEPTISIDADDLRRAIADVMREQLQAAIVEPVTAHLHRSLDLARGRVH